MDLYLAEPLGPFHTAVGAAFNTFTTKKDVSPQPLPVIPAGKLRLGSKLYLRASGEFSTTGTPTMRLGFWLGTRAGSITVDIAVNALAATGSGAAAWPWTLEWEGLCTAIGVTGSLVGQGAVDLGTSLTAVASGPIPLTQALRTVAIDTTIERALGVSAEFGASSASNQVIVNNLRAMVWN